MPIEIPTARTEWSDDKRLAGVSSFGFSGTNAHVIVGNTPTTPEADTVETKPAVLLPLSARTPAALDGLAEKWGEHLVAARQAECGDACFTAAVGRAHLRERAAVVATDGAELAGAFERGELVTAGPARRAAIDVEPVFLFTGFGAQSVGMGMALYEHSPVYRQAIDACASVLDEHLDRPLLDVIGGETIGQDALVNQTRYGQPALFALEYALAMLWRSWGIEPAAVAGHSLGEIVAACVANVFSLEDALRFVAERSRLIGELPPGGGMAAVFAPADDVRSALQSMNSSLDIAAINGAANTVVSGDAAEIDALLETFKQRGIDSRRLVVSHAFHSSRLDPMVSALEAYVSGIAVRPPSIPLMSNLTGQEMRDAPDPHYWGRHAREAVRFQEGVQSLVARGYRWFIEIGPHPSLLPMVHENLSDGTGLLVPSLRRGVEEWSQLLEGLASLYVNGANIDWGAFYGVKKRQRRAVPTYSFDRRSFWLDTSSNTRRTAGTAVDLPLLDARLDVPVPTFRTVFDERSERFVFGHRVGGGAVVSAPIFAELAGEATANVSGIGDLEIRELSLTAPLELADGGQTELYTTVTEKPDATYDVRMFAARSNDEQSWIQHAAAIVAPASSVQSTRVSPLAPEELAANHTQHDPAEFYSGLAEMGIQLEHGLAGMSELWQDDDGNVVARIELDRDTLTPEIYRLHPAMADAAMQALGAAVSLRENGASSHMLAGIERIGTWRDGGRTAWARAVLRNQQTGNGSADGAGIADWVGDIVLYDDSREVIAAIEGVTLKHAALHPSTGDSAAWFYRLEWNQHVPNLPLTSFGVAGDLSPPDVVEQAAVGSLTDASAELSVYDEALPRLDQLAYHYISTAFSALALNDLPHFSLEEACKTGRVANRHRRLMQRLCQILVGAGVLRDDDSGYSWTGATLEEADDAAHLAASFPACGAEITLLERCGTELASVLRDEVDPVALLFAEDSRETLHQLYRETPFAKHMNNALATALDCALGSVPTTRPLRILEVGAGTGGTTQFVLTKLAGRRLSYCFTDVSPSFLSSAEQEFGSDGELTYHLLDIERDPSEQGFTPQSFDIVISANAIHATEDVAASMRHIETLLAPGGAVFLLEGTSREPWVDLTFGLTDGWWRFTDTELRSDYPLLSRGQWCHAFSDVGFDSVSATPSGSDRGGSQALVMGRKPQQEDWYPQPLRGRRWVVVHSGGEVSTELLGALPNAVNLPYDPVQGESDWRSRLGELGSDESGLSTEFIFLCAPVDGDPTATVAASLGFVRAMMRADLQGARVWLVTSGGVAVGEGGSDVVPSQAPAWGLGRGLSLERPDLWGGIIDVEAASHAPEQAWSIIESVCADGDEDQIAYRSGAQHVARLERFSPVGEERCSYPSDGACLITGGLGGLGLALAERLAQRGGASSRFDWP